MKRAGAAIPLVMVLMVITLPVAVALLMRSHHATVWMQKMQTRDSATHLAEEGETAALDHLGTGAGPGAGSRPTPDGAMNWSVFTAPAGAAGQTQWLIAAEGVHLGEERMVISIAEVEITSGVVQVLPRDRAWLPPAGGSGPLDPNQLRLDHQVRIDRYLDRMASEQALSTPVFLDRMRTQLDALDNPAIAGAWFQISPALDDAKIEPESPPPLTLAELTDLYQLRYQEYLDERASGDIPEANDKHDEFLEVFRVYQQRARP